MADRKLRVFICHSSDDKPAVRDLNERLKSVSWIETWLDEERIEVGQDWEHEIEGALNASDAVIVSLSRGSVTKEGYVQRELRFVIDIATEKPEGTIFILPVRLEECEPPRKLRSYHYADYYPVNQRSQAFTRIKRSLELRAKQLGVLSADPVISPEKIDASILSPQSNNSYVKHDLFEKISDPKPLSEIAHRMGDSAQSVGHSNKRSGRKELSFLEKLEKFWKDNSWRVYGTVLGLILGLILFYVLVQFVTTYYGYSMPTKSSDMRSLFEKIPWLETADVLLILGMPAIGYFISDYYSDRHK